MLNEIHTLLSVEIDEEMKSAYFNLKITAIFIIVYISPPLIGSKDMPEKRKIQYMLAGLSGVWGYMGALIG